MSALLRAGYAKRRAPRGARAAAVSLRNTTMKCFLCAAVGLASAGPLPHASTPDYGSMWMQRGYDAGKSGRTLDAYGPTTLRVRWQLPITGAQIEAYPAVDVYGNIFVGSINKILYRINGWPGTMNYTIAFSDKTLGSPVRLRAAAHAAADNPRSCRPQRPSFPPHTLPRSAWTTAAMCTLARTRATCTSTRLMARS